MSNRIDENLTYIATFFLQPANSTHRQYEALRAFFVEGLPSAEAARRFGYSPGSFRVLCHEFRQQPHRDFFRPPRKGPTVAPKRDRVREQVLGRAASGRSSSRRRGKRANPSWLRISETAAGLRRSPDSSNALLMS